MKLIEAGETLKVKNFTKLKQNRINIDKKPITVPSVNLSELP